MLDEQLIFDEFPLDPGLVYLNHAAVAPWPACTAAAVIRFAEENRDYGASRYTNWMAAENDLRSQLQRLINAPSIDDIALLKNTSEAISVVASGLDWRMGDNVVSSDEEFPSNRMAWQAQQQRGVELRQVSLDTDDPEGALIAACDKRTRILTISSVQYASGRRLDLTRLGQFCHSNNILFCVDAIQSLGALQTDVQAIHADFLMADAHKWLLGPEGIAVFYCAGRLREQLQLHQFGWHMVEALGDYDRKDWEPARTARRFECGSMNMVGIFALSASLSLLEQVTLAEIETIVLRNTRYMMEKLNNIENVQVMTPVAPNGHAGILSFKIASRDNGQIHRKLLENQVICACRGGGIRFSPHFYTTTEKLDKAIEILKLII